MGTTTRGVLDMTVCRPQWTASRAELSGGRKEDTASNFVKDKQRMVKDGAKT